MATLQIRRPDSAAELDLRAAFPNLPRLPGLRPSRQQPPAAQDPIEQMAAADRADWLLMRLVLCSATATLLLGLALSLQPL